MRQFFRLMVTIILIIIVSLVFNMIIIPRLSTSVPKTDTSTLDIRQILFEPYVFDLNKDEGMNIIHKKRDYNQTDIFIIQNIEPDVNPYANIILKAIESARDIYSIDPLLIVALIRQESDFVPHAVSWAGAGGLMQFMPETASGIGMKKVYMTEDYKNIGKNISASQKHYREAIKYFESFDFVKAKSSLLKSREENTNYAKYSKKYKDDLQRRIKGKTNDELALVDERFIPDTCIVLGVRHLAYLLEKNNGDIRLALSSYNAGYGNVLKYEGIPNFYETVMYQNRITNKYKYYLSYIKNKEFLKYNDRNINYALK